MSCVSDPDPHSIGRPDPDPGGLKRTKWKKNSAKSQIISHKSIKINKFGKIYITFYIIFFHSPVCK
jgi:hypothetical protein